VVTGSGCVAGVGDGEVDEVVGVAFGVAVVEVEDVGLGILGGLGRCTEKRLHDTSPHWVSPIIVWLCN